MISRFATPLSLIAQQSVGRQANSFIHRQATAHCLARHAYAQKGRRTFERNFLVKMMRSAELCRFKKLAHQALDRGCLASALHQNTENETVLIDRAKANVSCCAS